MQQAIADLKRYKVYNELGDRLGVVDDFILDTDEWKVCYAVLRYEADGAPNKFLGVTLDSLELDSENEGLVVSADEDALRAVRGIDKESPPERPDPLFRRREP